MYIYNLKHAGTIKDNSLSLSLSPFLFVSYKHIRTLLVAVARLRLQFYLVLSFIFSRELQHLTESEVNK